MNAFRWLTLLLGPLPLVGASYWLSLAESSPLHARRDLQPLEPFNAVLPPADAVDDADADRAELARRCRQVAAGIRERLGNDWQSVIHPPYVLIGNVSTSRLEQEFRQTILPTARALAVSYFDRPPDAPVTLVLCSDAHSYRRCALRLDGREPVAYHGYYRKQSRRAVLDLSTGNGTVAHELTHALAEFDFPQMPEWFDEGLASLHEHCRFSADGRRLIGVVNWRGQYLGRPLRDGSLLSLETLLKRGRVRPEQEPVDYAMARYFCLYLQQRALLEPFYRKFRATADVDPTGRHALESLIAPRTVADLDAEFRQWLRRVIPH